MSDALAGLLAWFYELVPNYALAIVLLTLVVMVVLTPLTMKGTRSMMAMQRLAPEMKKLQERYKDDREKLNEEMLRFYKENKINPLSGCLPLFIQMPVFIVLFGVLRGLTQLESTEGANVGWMVGNAAAGSRPSALPEVVRTFDPGYLDHTSALYRDLVGQTHMKAFGIDLATSALGSLADGLVKALPYILLVAIVGVTSWYQQQQISSRNQKRGVSVDPNMAIMTKVMPLMLPVFSVGMPSGLVVYFVASNAYRVGQQGWINYTMTHHEADGVVETTARDTEGAPSDQRPAKKQKQKQLEGGDGEQRPIQSKRTGGGSGAKGNPKKKK